jgi:hypothetical protein
MMTLHKKTSDGEDEHGFSLTSPQPKAFAQNLEKIYSSLEQVRQQPVLQLAA